MDDFGGTLEALLLFEFQKLRFRAHRFLPTGNWLTCVCSMTEYCVGCKCTAKAGYIFYQSNLPADFRWHLFSIQNFCNICNILKRFFASRGSLCWSFFLILNRIAAAVLTHDIQETRDILPILCYTQIYKLYIPPWAVQCGRGSEIENL